MKSQIVDITNIRNDLAVPANIIQALKAEVANLKNGTAMQRTSGMRHFPDIHRIKQGLSSACIYLRGRPPHWTILGLWPSWAIWGPSRGYLGQSWGHLGLSGGYLGPSWSYLGVILAPAWSHLGAILGLSWGHLGPSRGHHGSPWGLLGPFLGHLGPSWGHLGAILGPSWTILGPSWAILAPSWGHLGRL